MEFEFLQQLPKSDLDNRTTEEIIEECLRRIALYCPEWTDHNPSDPGITIVELFAWWVHEALERFNHIPLNNYIAFLELLGISLAPPVAAQANLTFYLTTEPSSAHTIPAETEVAAERTKAEEATVFSTDKDLTISKPVLGHFLTASTAGDLPQGLEDRTGNWEHLEQSAWRGNEQSLFDERPQPGNCFYLVLDSGNELDGNVLALTFQGARGTSTGINPHFPPRRWEAWDGKCWQPVLLGEFDDDTWGFSFEEIASEKGNFESKARVVLHLPQNFPVATFTAYRGHWLRCVLINPQADRPAYISSPRVTGLSVRSIGGTVAASQSILIRKEQLGSSNGKPGQKFRLQSAPILARREGEYIEVTPPMELPQTWQEVTDFADSDPQDRHYTIDSLTGTVQFGPRILEPNARRVNMPLSDRLTASGFEQELLDDTRQEPLQHQYGAIPPRGSTIEMVAYRIGGGEKGNVEAGMLRFPRSAIPLVASVTNHHRARYGADAESFEQAVLRVPQTLRTRDRAVTAEDFEVLTKQAGSGAIARVKCLKPSARQNAGRVSLLVVPQANTERSALGRGIAPSRLTLTPRIEQRILHYLDERRLLGVRVQLQTPNYVGVAVQAEVALEAVYNNPTARREILDRLHLTLYRYLNPLCGGWSGTGWTFGRPVYAQEIITLLQKTVGVRYVGTVLLFALKRQGETWQRETTPEPFIDPGPFGLICSWVDEQLRSGHDIRQITS